MKKNRNKAYYKSKKGLDAFSTTDFWVIKLKHWNPTHEEMGAAIEMYERRCPTIS
jgi:hypothetical protein